MLRALTVTCALAIIAGPAHAGELPRAIGMYTPAGTTLALVDSKVEVTVRGPFIEAVVTQRFQNKTDRATEATYVFPLPVDAAVSAMAIESGSKKIHASIEKRESAQQRYEDAVRAGVAGALLDQERPDVFTQTVAAVPAKSTVSVSLRFDTVARYQDGVWELALPLVVAPRYVPGAATNRPTTGSGRAPDTDRAPDASRVTPGGAPGAGGSTEVTLTFLAKPTDLTSPTHELKIGTATTATFTDPKTDHDAIIRWRTPAPAAGWVEQAPDGGYAAVVVEAPTASTPRPGAKTLRWILVLDRSAASRGDAEAIAHPFVRGMFAAMSGNDRVSVTGSDSIAWGSAADVGRAVEQAWPNPAGAFDLTRTLEKLRPEGASLVLVSGGLVADDKAAVAAAAKLGVPIHVVGVGPAPARGLLSQIAAATGGTTRFAAPGDDTAALARATLIDISAPPPVLAVNWGTLSASEVVPGTVPRLGAGQATIVLAKVSKAQTANGRARGELFAIEALPTARAVDGATTAMGPLARRWARNRLDELIAARAAPSAITAHALRYGLVSPYTSMVAVGDEVVVQGGVKRSIAVPVSVPAGMKWQQVKKETTVDKTGIDARVDKNDKKKPDKVATNSKDKEKDGFAKRPPQDPKPEAKEPPGGSAKRDPKKGKQAPVVKQEPRKPEPRGGMVNPAPPPAQPTTGAARPQISEDDEEKPSKKAKRKKNADEDGDLDGKADDDSGVNPSPDYGRAPAAQKSIAANIDAADVTLGSLSESGRGKRWRLALGASGGFVRAGGASTSLLSAGARLELRIAPHLMVGGDGALWLVDGETVVGRTMLSFAVTGIQRFVELGFGFGLQLGDNATGPAAGVSLRVHLPPQPRASLYLRYDGALITNGDTRQGQNGASVGVEWSF